MFVTLIGPRDVTHRTIEKAASDGPDQGEGSVRQAQAPDPKVNRIDRKASQDGQCRTDFCE